MGGAMSIARLIIDPGDITEGNSEFAGAQACVAIGGSGCEALDDSLGPEILAFLAGGRRTELWGCEAVAPCVVDGLLVSYLREGAEDERLVGTPPSEEGIYGASMVASGGGESRGTQAEEALCLREWLYEGVARAPRVCAIWKWRNRPRVPAPRGVLNGRRTEEWDARGRGRGGRMNRGWNQNRGTGWHYEEATRWHRDSQWEGAWEIGGNWGVRVREVFKNKLARVFCTMLGVRNGFADPLDFHTINLKFVNPLDFRIVCELVLDVRNVI